MINMDVWSFIKAKLKKDKQIVLMVVIDSSGSSPGRRGFKMAVDSDGNIYVCDALFDAVQIFDRHGRLLLAFGDSGSQPGQFWMPAGIFIDNHDTIYVADTYNRRVQIFRYLKGD